MMVLIIRASSLLFLFSVLSYFFLFFFFFNDTATTEIYTLSLHDALPISFNSLAVRSRAARTSSRSAFNSFGFGGDRKSTRLNSSHVAISYAVFCLKKKKKIKKKITYNIVLYYIHILI